MNCMKMAFHDSKTLFKKRKEFKPSLHILYIHQASPWNSMNVRLIIDYNRWHWNYLWIHLTSFNKSTCVYFDQCTNECIVFYPFHSRMAGYVLWCGLLLPWFLSFFYPYFFSHTFSICIILYCLYRSFD